ncbi:hypothetical protein BJX76DRAFT_357856 [Aspergillus varians]
MSGTPVPANPTWSQLGQLPERKELHDLIELYFSSVHHFGFFAFIHPLHFQRLLVNGKAPRELTLLMIASATRFAAPVTPENLARADAWADSAIGALLPHIYQGFGAIQLMAALLAQHYDHHRGHFTSAWLLGGNCTRMMQIMSLHLFDRAYPADFLSHKRLSPLLSREALRRIAWCTFYLDSMTDGGRYGSQTVDERAYRLQLPCDQESFLGDDNAVTEPLLPGDVNTACAAKDGIPHASLDMSAYLLRTAAARRRGLHFAFRASYQENTVERLSADLVALEHDMDSVFTDLPRRFQFNPENIVLHRERLPMFVLLHVLRQNLFIILGRAALQIYLRDPTKESLVYQVRRDRISRALAVSELASQGLSESIIFDPHIGVQAYVAFESTHFTCPNMLSDRPANQKPAVLLFEPRRLASVDASNDANAPKLMEGITHLLTVIRNIASRSAFTKHLYLEAIHRLINCDCVHLLDQRDLTAIRSKHPLVGQDAAEFNFRDFQGAKLERLSNRTRPSGDDTISATTDEVLLEDSIRNRELTGSPAASPGPVASEASNLPAQSAESQRPCTSPDAPGPSAEINMPEYALFQDDQQWSQLVEPGNTDHLFSSLNWMWPFNEWSDHLGTPTGLSNFR